MNQELSLIVLAAGMWSRYWGLKQIDEFWPNWEGLLEYAVYDAIKAWFQHMVFVIRKDFEEEFVTKFEKMLAACPRFSLVRQEFDPEFWFTQTATREKPWWTLHATLSCSHVINWPFAVVNADDRYGTKSYYLIAERLKHIDNNKAFLVWYVLWNTLSDHGFVNRGICQVEEGQLQEVVEHRKIGKVDWKITDHEQNFLTWTETVSMNFWWFHQDFFKQAHPLFVQFVLNHSQTAIAEMVIPDAIDTLIHDEILSCTVIPSPDSWQWVTNAEDKPRVQKAFTEMIQDWVYPLSLWE